MIYYENGIEINRKEHLKNKLGNLTNSLENYIGKSKYAADPNMNGYVDEFRIYSKALTSKEINQLMCYNISDKEIVSIASDEIGLEEKEELSDRYHSRQN